jgi:hypothetical protein
VQNDSLEQKLKEAEQRAQMGKNEVWGLKTHQRINYVKN